MRKKRRTELKTASVHLTSVQTCASPITWFEPNNINTRPDAAPAKVNNFSVIGSCAHPEGVVVPYPGGWIINQLGEDKEPPGSSDRQEARPQKASEWPGGESVAQEHPLKAFEGWGVPHSQILVPQKAHVPPVPPTVPLIPLPPRRGVTFHLPPRHMNIPPDSSSENGNENVRVDEEKEEEEEEGEEEEEEEDEEEEEGDASRAKGKRCAKAPSGGTWVCQYPRCGKVMTPALEEAYKECHQCHTLYCSRPCRRMHWDTHKRHCLRILARSLAKELILTLRHKPKVLEQLSVVARRGLRSLGRGAVKIFFRDAEEIENFLLDLGSPPAQREEEKEARKEREGRKEKGHGAFPQLHYVTSQDLLPQEMGEDTYRKICQLCRVYNTSESFVLYVSICVLEGGGGGGTGQGIGGGGSILSRVSRCVKLKLAPEEAGGGGGDRGGGGGGGGGRGGAKYPQRFVSCPTSSSSNAPPLLAPLLQQNFISRDFEGEPETLVLTPLRDSNRDPPLPPMSSEETPATRLATYHNILHRLGERGVSLRHQYPEVERRLRAFVELGHVFPPVTIQPRNASTGSTFLCVIMPRLDLSKLELLTRRNSRVVTLDVSPYDGGSSSTAKKTGLRR
ncbi:apical junction component 1 homolog isoform X2 [Penaeus vannamei]|uniref:apical junction component 1 homolog isoform X2 n=1 Tax=Penaeus vannamei TaxID=6689 RepID=UPI00387F82E9